MPPDLNKGVGDTTKELIAAQLAIHSPPQLWFMTMPNESMRIQIIAYIHAWVEFFTPATLCITTDFLSSFHFQFALNLSDGTDSRRRLIIIIIIICPLTAQIVEALQMILQPVFSILSCSPLPSGT